METGAIAGLAPDSPFFQPFMVVLAQLVEHRVVVPRVAGSSPVHHPFGGETVAVKFPQTNRR